MTWVQTRTFVALALSPPCSVCTCVTLPGVCDPCLTSPPPPTPYPQPPLEGTGTACGEGCTPAGLGDSAPAETATVASCSWRCVLTGGRVSESFVAVYVSRYRITCAFRGAGEGSGRGDQNPQAIQSFLRTSASPVNFFPFHNVSQIFFNKTSSGWMRFIRVNSQLSKGWEGEKEEIAK